MSKVWLHHQVNELGNLNLFPIFPLFLYKVMFFLICFFWLFNSFTVPFFFFHSSDQWVPRRTGVSNFEFFPLKFRTHDRLMPVIKGTHAVSYETALTWTLLLPVWKEFTSTQNQMYASATSRNPLQSCLVYHSILDLLQKTSFWANLTHPMALFYHIWLKTVSKGTWTEEVRNA